MLTLPLALYFAEVRTETTPAENRAEKLDLSKGPRELLPREFPPTRANFPRTKSSHKSALLSRFLKIKSTRDVNATLAGHSWAMLPCTADQECPRGPLNFTSVLNVERAPLLLQASDHSRAPEVSNFVLNMSLDILRAGDTGEARLRARRHSAYGPGGGTATVGVSRCGDLIQPSTTTQLHRILKQTSWFRESHRGGSDSPTPAKGKFVAFTITDMTYGDMLNDVWAQIHRLKMEDSFFYVALDKPTALAACHNHMPVLYFSEPLAEDSKSQFQLPKRSKKFSSTKDRVYEAK